MDRKTRKANLRKLQLPGSNASRQVRATNAAAPVIYQYFTNTPENENTTSINTSQMPPAGKQFNNCEQISNSFLHGVEQNNTEESETSPISQSPKTESQKGTNFKRTKLKTFLKKDEVSMDADDLEVFEERKAKRFPSSKTTKTKKRGEEKTKRNPPKRSKRQQSIKSAFLRNEQLFSEITAQHCLADNFNPDDMQLALAISKSEAETSGIICVDNESETVVDIDKGTTDTVQESIRNKLRSYGFRTAPKDDYKTIAAAAIQPAYFTNRRSKSKWANKFTALTLRDPALQLKKVNERINDLLSEQCTTMSLNANKDDSFTKPYSFELYSFSLNPLKPPSPNEEVFRRAKYFETMTVDKFYVKSLFEVSRVKPGHLLKDWSRVQGRDQTPSDKSSQRLRVEQLKTAKFMKAYKQLEIIFFKKVLDKNEQMLEDQSLPDKIEECQEKQDIFEEKPLQPDLKMQNASGRKNGRAVKEIAELNPVVTTEFLKADIIEVSVNNIVCEEESIKHAKQYKKTKNHIQNFENKIKYTEDPIHNALTPLKGPPDKKQKLQSPGLPMNGGSSVELTQQVRETSPDLFADSDDDEVGTAATDGNLSKTDETDNYKEEIQIVHTDKHGIEIVEKFSSDDVKTSAKTTITKEEFKDSTITVDLTKDDMPQSIHLEKSEKSNIPEEDFDIFSNSLENSKSEKELEHSVSANEEVAMDNVEIITKVIVQYKNPNNLLNFINTKKQDNEKLYDQELLGHEGKESKGVKELREIGCPKKLLTNNSFFDFIDDKEKSESLPLRITLSNHFSPAYDFNTDVLNNDLLKLGKGNNLSADSVRSIAKGRFASMVQLNKQPPPHYSRKRLSFTQMEQKAYSAIANNDISSGCFSNNILNRRTMSASIPSVAFDEASSSIDLSQGSHDADEDECIILSDDEINYSIWKANETMNLQVDKEPPIYTHDLSLSSDGSDDEKVMIVKDDRKDLLNAIFSDSEQDSEGIKKLNIPDSEDRIDLALETKEFNDNSRKGLSFTQSEQKSYNEFESNDDLGRCAGSNFSDWHSKSIFLSTPKYQMTNLSKCAKKDDFVINPKHLSFSQFEEEARSENGNILNRRSKSACISIVEDHHEARSIDLTQKSIEKPEEDDCVIISDDEMNCSSSKACKAMNLLSMRTSVLENKAITSESPLRKNTTQETETYNTSRVNLCGDGYISKTTTEIKERSVFFDDDFSFLELLGIEDDHSKDNKEREEKDEFNFGADYEPMKQQDASFSEADDLYLYTTPQRLHESNKNSFDWDKITKTPLTKPSTKKFRSRSENIIVDASFLDTPSEKLVPMKQYSSVRSSQKFNSLLRQVQLEQAKAASSPSTPFDEDFDEFDKLVYGTPKPEEKRRTLKDPSPAGLHQLLTAEISFRADRNNDDNEGGYRTPKRSFDNEVDEICTESDSKEILHVNGKIYEVRVTTTPKPNFSLQSDADLMKQVYKFGMKPLQRKQALLMLEYIYNQTHPILGDKIEEEAVKGEELTVEKEVAAVEELEVVCISTQTARNPESKSFECLSLKPLASVNKLNLSDCFGELLLRYGNYLHAELPEEDYIFQTNVSKKTSQALLPLHVAWFNLICSSIALHEAIIMFQPIDLHEIYLFLKSIGYRYDPKDLKNFFDRRCIIFRYELGGPGKSNGTNRHVRKSKKKTKTKLC